MRDNEPDHLDALIDDAARAMTAGSPPASLRDAVRRRIDRPARTWWRVPMWQAGMAAASIVLVGVIVGRTLSGPFGEPDTARPFEAREATVAPLAMPAADTPPPQTQVVGRFAREARPLVPAQPIVVQPIALEPLADVHPVELELMEVPMPLRAEWVEIERLVFE